MEMWLSVSTLVFLTVALAGVVLSAQTVVFLGNDSQERVTVPSGSSLTLCCLVNTSNSGTFRMEWYFKSSNSSGNNHENSFKCIHEERKLSLKTILDQKQCRVSDRTHTLSNVNEMESGWYYCKVIQEIPLLKEMESIHTEVYVSKNAKESTTYPSLMTREQVTPLDSGVQTDWWIWIVVGVSSVVLIVLLLLVICVWRKRGCPTSTATEQIYVNTRRQPSPQPSTLKMHTAATAARPARRYEEKCSHIHRGGH